mmetsp:Transcript_11554/g.26871  ORF Transcript_11554/g.26871 Transcript_11554/m.26871 type:complete len:294 (+) Transcript_11554:117-998(+)|eukprot:CAMPEP_0178413632 /NCGR_PEP_ID=MMETSP0689_2-20121128/22627_1 /TAXON_ID=160604 /ORGANISM="Amphidinium massartii, Strain CS-259" /LENGTH=293 /DNA_ID=CAMNT_0020034909 /DNA_START=31 /DNA_END=912 /DNA_ORIENTATION=+
MAPLLSRMRGYDFVDRFLDPGCTLGAPLLPFPKAELKPHKKTVLDLEDERRTEPPSSEIVESTESEESDERTEKSPPSELTETAPISAVEQCPPVIDEEEVSFWMKKLAVVPVASWLPHVEAHGMFQIVPSSVLGEWQDSIGNKVVVECVATPSALNGELLESDAQQDMMEVVARLSRPPRPDICLKVRQSLWDGQLCCGGATLRTVSDGIGEIVWEFPDGRISKWARRETVVSDEATEEEKQQQEATSTSLRDTNDVVGQNREQDLIEDDEVRAHDEVANLLSELMEDQEGR